MNVSLYIKKDFIIKLRILRWRDYSGLSRWDLSINTSAPTKTKADGFDYGREGDMITEAEIEVMCF